MTSALLTEETAPAEDLAATALKLARRFAAGATMWCVSPQWPSHGRHVAVEFVHPVIVGKRALPAVHVDGVDPVATLRMLARPGDVFLAISSAADQSVASLLQRCDAWGLTRVWLGAGPRPPAGLADNVAWVDGCDPAVAARSGDMVLLYHLLWELTHVVFEHPGLLVEPPECEGEVCITCSDEGRVAEVEALGSAGQASVLVAGRHETVDVSLVDVAPGDLVLVHAGVAVTALGQGAP